MSRLSCRIRVFWAVVAIGLSVCYAPATQAGDASDTEPFTLVVMDPLASPLACDCVEGYAQRKYEVLGEFLKKQLNREVRVVFAQSLVKALKEEAKGRADLIVGKHSVVASDAEAAKVHLSPIAQLTGSDGKTTQTGLFVVRHDDPAQTVADIAGYRIFFGPAECAEKSAAPMRLMKKHGVAVPEEIETVPACSDGAVQLMELGSDVRAAAVISSYAQPLLEGCGTVKKGDLRVIGETEAVPFITAFTNDSVSADIRDQVIAALDEVQYDIKLLIALETKRGFVAWEEGDRATKGKVAVSKKKP